MAPPGLCLRWSMPASAWCVGAVPYLEAGQVCSVLARVKEHVSAIVSVCDLLRAVEEREPACVRLRRGQARAWSVWHAQVLQGAQLLPLGMAAGSGTAARLQGQGT